MAASLGSKRYRVELRFVVFDVPVLLGADLRGLPWQERRERLELLARGFDKVMLPFSDPMVLVIHDVGGTRSMSEISW